MRRWAWLIASLVAVLVLGGLAVWTQVSASRQVSDSHRADRSILQQTLSGLTEQYLNFTVLATNTAATDHRWQLSADSPADRANLQSLVRSSPLTSYGAAIVSLSGTTLSAYPSTESLPAPTDRGFVPLQRALLAGQPGVSDVMRVHGVPVVAFAVPITRGHQPLGLLVTLADLRSWPLQSYDGKLRIGPQASSYVLDSAGTIAAARDQQLIGTRLTAATGGHPAAGLSTVHLDGKALLVARGPAGHGWSAVTVQPEQAFSGRLTRSRDLAFLALALLLSLAVALLLVLHHKRQQALARLAEERLYDPLTGLAQRGAFELRVNAALARLRRNARPLAVLYCDLDDFKAVNDRHGHNTGDQLLVAVSQRISQAVRDTDMVARLGGDEFAIVMEDTTADETRRIGERVRRLVGEPLELGGRSFTPQISIGAAFVEDDAADLASVLHEADMAMYAAKRHAVGGPAARTNDAAPAIPSARRSSVAIVDARDASTRGDDPA